ncbi:MAG: 4Fe-4S binding protein [Thermoleophilia bacterium]|jgi:ferredoxin|nr:4Fe-4S binding protein [Thermoleophilia bacterium]
MPLTDRGREILKRLPATHARSSGSIGCEIVRHDDLCIGCGTCAKNCPTGASRRGDTFDVHQLLDAPAGSRRGDLGAALRRLMRTQPAGPVEVPPRVTVFRTILYDDERCIGCGSCARNCPVDAIEARPPEVPATAPEGVGAEVTS